MCPPANNPAIQGPKPPFHPLQNITSFVIAQDGDLELVVGRTQLRIRVCSTVLRDASPIFTTMLRSYNFSAAPVAVPAIEAETNPNADNPNRSIGLPVLHLPHENCSAILWLCGILHQYADFHDFPTSALLFATANRAVLYQCVPRATFVFQAWITDQFERLRPIRETDFDQRDQKSATLFHLFMTSEILGLSNKFREISRELILFHDGSFMKLCQVPAFHVNFMWCIAALEEARGQLHALLSQAIHAKKYETVFPNDQHYSKKRIQHYFTDFGSHWAAAVWQPWDQYQSPTFQTFLAVNEIATEGEGDGNGNEYENSGPNPVAKHVGQIVRQLDERFQGICRLCLSEKPGTIVIGPCAHCQVEFQVEGLGQSPWIGLI